MNENKKEKQTENEANPMDFIVELLSMAKESLSSPQQPASYCVDKSQTYNDVRVSVNVFNQPKPGILRRLLAKFL